MIHEFTENYLTFNNKTFDLEKTMNIKISFNYKTFIKIILFPAG